MLALAASDETTEPLPESVSALQTATQSMRLVDVVDGVGDFSVAYHPDGSMVAVDRGPGQPGVVFIDPASGDVLGDVETPYTTWGLAFEPGGAELAVAYEGSSGAPAIGRFEMPGGHAAGAFSGPAGSYDQLSYHPDGRWVGAARQDDEGPERDIVVWSVDSPDAPISLGPGTSYAFLPGTASVAIAGGDEQGALAVVDIETGEVVGSIDIPDIEVDYGIAVDPTGHRLALVSFAAEQVVVVDLDRGEPVDTLDVVGPHSADFSDDGRWLAVGSLDNRVHLFDTEDFAKTLLAGSPTLLGRRGVCSGQRPAGVDQRRPTSVLGAGAGGSPHVGELRHVGPGGGALGRRRRVGGRGHAPES